MRARASLFALAGALLSCAGRDVAPTPVPSPWSTRIEDVAWLEGRWAGRDATGACHVEHWLGPRDGSMWVMRQTGDVIDVARVTAADLGRRGDREVVIDRARRWRVHDRLHADGLVLERVDGIAARCR